MKTKRADDVLRSVEEFAKPDYGIDVFKLESPVNASDADGSADVQALFTVKTPNLQCARALKKAAQSFLKKTKKHKRKEMQTFNEITN